MLTRLGLGLLAATAARTPLPSAIRPAQARIRTRLIAALADLPVGRQTGLDRLPRDDRLADAFRREIPLMGYADAAGLIGRVARGERDVMFRGRAVALAITSGTTSSGVAGERFIPQSRALLAHHRRGGASALARLHAQTGAGLAGGRMLLMGGSTDLRPNAHGVPAGDLSGIVVSQIPRLLCRAYEPGREIAMIADWPAKLAAMTRRTAEADLRLASGIGSWLLSLFAAVCRQRGVERAGSVWPGLRAVIHGGHAIEPMIGQFRHHLPDATLMQEVYPASEAFIAIGRRPWRLGAGRPEPLELLSDHGVLLELCPDDDPRPEACVGPEAIEPDRLYRVTVTTPGGLVRWQMGDLVRGVSPGLVRFAGRVRTRISVFGEHVEGDLIAAAIAASGARLRHCTVAPILPADGGQRGAHQWLVEPEPGTRCEPSAFAAAVDGHLRRHCADYDAHRSVQLEAPSVTVLPEGTFERWLGSHGRLGGQHKVPQAWPDRTIAEQLLRSIPSGSGAVGGRS